MIGYPLAKFAIDICCATRLEKISGHKILQWTLPCDEVRAAEYRVPDKLRWSAPLWMSRSRWNQLFDEASMLCDTDGWCDVLRDLSQATFDQDADADQQMVGFHWQLTFTKVAAAFRRAAQLALLEVPGTWSNMDEISRKEHLANHMWIMPIEFVIKRRRLPKNGAAQTPHAQKADEAFWTVL